MEKLFNKSIETEWNCKRCNSKFADFLTLSQLMQNFPDKLWHDDFVVATGYCLASSEQFLETFLSYIDVDLPLIIQPNTQIIINCLELATHSSKERDLSVKIYNKNILDVLIIIEFKLSGVGPVINQLNTYSSSLFKDVKSAQKIYLVVIAFDKISEPNIVSLSWDDIIQICSQCSDDLCCQALSYLLATRLPRK